MPPRPIKIPIASGRLQPGQPTPRTPHSRSGRAEEGFTEIELEQYGDSDYREHTLQQQREPLLASSASASFPPSGYRAKGDDDLDIQRKSRGPLLVMQWLVAHCGLVIGSALALVLLLMTILSYNRPDILRSATGLAEISPTPISTPKQVDVPPLHPENIISYENYSRFPLDPLEYKTECHKLMGEFMRPMKFWSGEQDVVHHDQVDPGKYPAPEGMSTQICSKTITYMLDGHVGLLADLALMAQTAGLAREAGRTFLVDDTYWNRGKFVTCLERHEQQLKLTEDGQTTSRMFARANQGLNQDAAHRLRRNWSRAREMPARHWVINSQTAKYHFGHAFSDEFEDPYGRELNRLRSIFNRSRVSLTETIRPNAATAALIHSARTELTLFLGLQSNDAPLADQYQSIHVRRGDGMGSSWKYHDENVAVKEYTAAGNAAWTRLFRSAGNLAPQTVYLASDDPDIFEVVQSQLEPGSRIFSLSKSENSNLRHIASPAPYFQGEFDALPEADRVRLTKGMVVDFALLSGLWAWHDDLKPGAVICGISSNVCKLAAIALDWDLAFGYGFRDDSGGEVNQEHARWIEVDEKGGISPPWRPFQMF